MGGRGSNSSRGLGTPASYRQNMVRLGVEQNSIDAERNYIVNQLTRPTSFYAPDNEKTIASMGENRKRFIEEANYNIKEAKQWLKEGRYTKEQLERDMNYLNYRKSAFSSKQAIAYDAANLRYLKAYNNNLKNGPTASTKAELSKAQAEQEKALSALNKIL